MLSVGVDIVAPMGYYITVNSNRNQPRKGVRNMKKYYIEYYTMSNKGITFKYKTVEAESEVDAINKVQNAPKKWNIDARTITIVTEI